MFKKALIISMICLSIGSVGLARGRSPVVGSVSPAVLSNSK